MQREGIDTVNIYGTPHEPLWKSVYLTKEKYLQKIEEMRKEVVFKIFDLTKILISSRPIYQQCAIFKSKPMYFGLKKDQNWFVMIDFNVKDMSSYLSGKPINYDNHGKKRTCFNLNMDNL